MSVHGLCFACLYFLKTRVWSCFCNTIVTVKVAMVKGTGLPCENTRMKINVKQSFNGGLYALRVVCKLTY